MPHPNPLGDYLRDRRARLDPAAFGFSASRRRTPGLRREEVAQLADVSATWYTWLEQGRGGTPSADALDRLAGALALGPVEREHLFLLAQNRPPEVRYHPSETVEPRLQRVLDAFTTSPALLKNVVWDVLAWNRAATVVLTDYGAVPPEERNILRRLFLDPERREALPDWEGDARFLTAAFRAEVARAGASREVSAFVEELCDRSEDFARMWRAHDVRNYGGGSKTLVHPTAGPLTLDFSALSVDGTPDLGLIVFTPATPEDEIRIRSLLDAEGG